MSNEQTLEEFTTAYKTENPDATDEDIKTAWDEKQLEGLNLTDKITKMMDEYGEMLVKQMEARLATRIDEVVAATQDELVGAIRKGVGLEEDPVIHLSEVTSVVRKILLEKDGDGKQTGDDHGKGPAGVAPPDSGMPAFDLEARHKEMLMKQGRGA